MATHVKAPDGSTIEFPDTMKDTDIESAMAKLFPPKRTEPQEPLKPTVNAPMFNRDGQVKAPAQPPQSGIGERVMSTILDPLVGSATTLGRGMHSLVDGGQSKSATAADLIEGGAGIALPFAVPSIIGRPIAALGGAALGYGAQKAGGGVAHLAGAGPDMERLAGDVTGAVAGPFVSKGAGAILGKPAPRLFENALGIKPTENAYGADPGRFGLEETSSVRPEVIAKQARAAIADKSAALDNRLADAERSGATLSVDPARDLVRSRINAASGANSTVTPRELRPMNRFLTKPTDNFSGATEFPAGANTPISFQQQPTGLLGANGAPMTRPSLVRGTAPSPVVSAEQPPTVFRDMKGQFDQDFIRNWNPTVNTKGQLGVARDAYHEMANEVNQKIPGAAPLNRGMQSLIPVANAAEKTEFKAGPMGRVIDRFTRPTGGLVAPLLAFGKGGPVAAAAMMTGQELAADPTTKLMGARTLFGLGNALRSAPAQVGSSMLPLIRRRDQ